MYKCIKIYAEEQEFLSGKLYMAITGLQTAFIWLCLQQKSWNNRGAADTNPGGTASGSAI